MPTIVSVIIIVIVAFIAYRIIMHVIKKAILGKAKTKTEISNARVLLSIWKHAFALILVIGLIFYLGGDFTGFGL